MYVNELTLDLGDLGRRALARLYDAAVRIGAIPAAPPLDIV
jgi:predicted solute-binding protein